MSVVSFVGLALGCGDNLRPAANSVMLDVQPASGLRTTEGGGTATFTVALAAQPAADVEIAVVSSDPGEGTVSPASITLTHDNWNVPVTVTITGVDDTDVDGDQTYTINLDTGSGTTTDVSVVNEDDDAPGATVTPTTGLTTTEAGGTATFTVVLHTQPSADVTIPVVSADATEGVAAPASLTFTSANWDVAQTVTVTGVDDTLLDGTQPYVVQVGPATSTDAAYDGNDPDDVMLDNTDDDTAGVTVTPTQGLETTEDGGTATFTVVLNAEPSADVTIPVTTSDATEGTVSAATLTFTAADWDIAQTITVTGVDDVLRDGDQSYTIVLGAAVSTDTGYAALDPADVAVTNHDNDQPAVRVTPTSGLITTEAGGAATFTVVLAGAPTADVTIPVTSSDLTEGTVSPATLTFTTANWNAPQTVTVTGVDDTSVDGNVAYQAVLGPAASTDTGYDTLAVPAVDLTNLDDESAGIIVTPTAGLVTTEAGGQATFTVRLQAAPTANVTIGVTTSDATEGTVSTALLTFTPGNFAAPQTVTITGVDDALADGDLAYTIVLAPATSTDAAYSGLDGADVSVTNLDDDTVSVSSFRITPTSGLVTTESGGTAQFTVSLATAPTADVTIAVTSSRPGEGTASTTFLTFTPVNFNAPQTVTITGVDDAIIDGDQPYTIVLGAAVSTDTAYAGLDPADVAVTNLDNDSPGVLVTPATGLVTTEGGGTATFDVVLLSPPTADVVIPLGTTDATEGTASKSLLTFTTVNWNAPQTVTVTGVDDLLADGNQAYRITLAPAISLDTAYSGFDAADVNLTNLDNETAGIRVIPTAGLVTTEAGGADQFQVVLQAQPAANVTVPVTTSDATEGTTSVTSLTFTPANWFLAQTVTVTGVDDAVADGDQLYTVILGAAASTDAAFAGIDPTDVSVTNIDNDTAAILVTPTTGLEVSEFGDFDTFDIVLTTQPTSNVTITLTSSDLTEGTVAPASVTFTPANYNVPQTVTVTGVDDTLRDGNQIFFIRTGVATSGDTSYDGIDPADVQVLNFDNDIAQVFVQGRRKLRTTESGGASFFRMRVTIPPTADVFCPVTSTDLTEGTVSTAVVVFLAGTTTRQTITVTGVDDAFVDGDQLYSVITGVCTSADTAYNGQNPRDLSALNRDND